MKYRKCPESVPERIVKRQGLPSAVVDSLCHSLYIVGRMPSHETLGEFELLVAMAVVHLGERSFAPEIRNELETRSDRRVTSGAVSVTLDRLEEKGVLTSKVVRSEGVRGVRPRRIFRATAAGVRAMRKTLAGVSRMHEGLEAILGEL